MIRRSLSTLRTKGALLTWGDGFHTQLGHKSASKLYRPTVVEGISAVDVFAGPRHTLILTPEGRMVGFGDNDFGQVGSGDSADIGTPRAVVELSKVKKAACGMNYSLAVTEEGDLYHWGYAGKGPNFLTRLFTRKRPQEAIHSVPKRLEALKSQAILDVAAGEYHYLALTQTGKVYSWGDNEYGSCGNGQVLSILPGPEEVEFFDNLPGGDKVQRVFACGSSSAALTRSGKLYAWGKNDQGQIAISTDEEDYKNRFVVEPLPKQVYTGPRAVVDFCLGSRTIVMLLEDGSVHIAGLSVWTIPYKVALANQFQVASVCCGEDYFAFVDKKGSVTAYGGPFTGEPDRSDDLPEGMNVVRKEFFGGSVAKLVGPYDYCAAIVYQS